MSVSDVRRLISRWRSREVTPRMLSHTIIFEYHSSPYPPYCWSGCPALFCGLKGPKTLFYIGTERPHQVCCTINFRQYTETGNADIGLRVGHITKELLNVRRYVRYAGWDPLGEEAQEDAHHFYLVLVNIFKDQLLQYVSPSPCRRRTSSHALLAKRCSLKASLTEHPS